MSGGLSVPLNHIVLAKILSSVILFDATMKCGDAAVEITSPPASLNVTLGSFALFACDSEGGPVNWMLNNNPDSSSWGNGVQLASFHQNGLHFSSSIRVSAIVDQNNSMIVCSAPGVQSRPAYLKIQGLLAAPGNLSLLSTNEDSIELIWEAPFTLDITGEDHSITQYLVIIRNRVTGEVFRGNTTNQQYTFIRPTESGSCDMYSISVVAVNAVGEGDEATMQSAFKSDIQLLQGEQSLFATFHCKVSCDIFGQTLWFLNGSLVNFGKDLNGIFLNKWASQIESKPCSSDDETDRYYVHSVELLTTSDLSEPLSVYCASVIICNKEEGCLPTICFSNKKKIRAIEKQILTLSNTEKGLENLTIGTCIALGIILFATLIVCICIVVVLSVKLKHRHAVETYYLDPPPEFHDLSMNVKGQCVEAVYEEPQTILQQPSPEIQKMQSCPAYA